MRAMFQHFVFFRCLSVILNCSVLPHCLIHVLDWFRWWWYHAIENNWRMVHFGSWHLARFCCCGFCPLVETSNRDDEVKSGRKPGVNFFVARHGMVVFTCAKGPKQNLTVQIVFYPLNQPRTYRMMQSSVSGDNCTTPGWMIYLFESRIRGDFL